MVRVNKHSLYTSIREKPAASAAPCFEDACLKLCSVWCAKAKSAGESERWDGCSAPSPTNTELGQQCLTYLGPSLLRASQPVTVRDFCITEVLHRHQTGEKREFNSMG